MRLPLWVFLCAATLTPALWEVGLVLLLRGRTMTEIEALTLAKIGFAALLAFFITIRRRWGRFGFWGGWQWRRWALLWPIWLGALISLTQLDTLKSVTTFPIWFAIACAIGFGEEGIFRGAIIDALRTTPRRAATLSALLFGIIHLIGLAAPIDSRMILAQAIVAGCIGLVLACTRLLSGSILPGFVAHSVLDFCGLIAANGFSAAMSYSQGALIYLIGYAVVALAWGLFLLRRLPAAENASWRVSLRDTRR